MNTAVAAPVVRGTPASPGRAGGPVYRVHPARSAGAGRPAVSAAAALEAVARRLDGLADSLPGVRAEGAAILHAQAAMARDPVLRGGIEARLAGGCEPAVALAEEIARHAARLEAIDDPYLRARAADVREVGRLAAAELVGGRGERLAGLSRPSIVFASDLSPADTLGADRSLLLGIATETGGPTSHAAIVARELGIPAVVGAAGLLAATADWQSALLDGDAGEVRPRASSEVTRSSATAGRLELGSLPVRLMANVGSLEGLTAAAARGALGIGLFRTEFMFLAGGGPLGEEEQAAAYARACQALAPHPVVIRTLDAGSDKPLPYLPGPAEPNPALGRRGARLWLRHRRLWQPQVRALVRVAREHSNLEVMVPMVAGREEMLAARRHFAAAAAELGGRVPRLGMMVEVPAVAAALDAFEGVADFISIGSNDLTQYTVAADRELEWEPWLAEFNPGVLRLIALATWSARRLGMEVAVCGEMAGRPEAALFLMGAGVEALSMTADRLPAVAEVLARVGIERARAVTREALRDRTAHRALSRFRTLAET